MKIATLVATFLAFATSVVVAAPRQTMSLNGAGWTADGEPVVVPHTWNAIDGADGHNGLKLRTNWDSINTPTYARRKVTYRRLLPDPTPGRRQFVRFGGVSRRTQVMVNGQLAGNHASAFTAFTVEVTKFLKNKGNVLEVICDNFIDEDFTPHSADFTLFGGVYRDVAWLETDPVCIDPVTDGADGVRLDIDPKTGHVKAFVRVLGGKDEVQEFDFPKPILWTPENPKLYEVEVKLASGDAVKVRFGFRTVEIRKDGFYLNGVKRKLRGMNRHQDRQGKGWAVSAADEEEDVRWLKRMGADAIRTAHYPQSRHFYDLCDEYGVLAWVEAPNVNFFTRTSLYREHAHRELTEMIEQNRNHASVFCWSIFNELNDANVEDMRFLYERELPALRELAHSLDKSRPVVGVSFQRRLACVNEVPDALGFNCYPGWYEGAAEDTTNVIRSITENVKRASWAMSEYGAGACIDQHDEMTKRVVPASTWHPEERQAFVHWQAYKALKAAPEVWGTFVWALFDFAADRRSEGSHMGMNDKGLITYDHKTPKDAFFLYEANWSKEPVLHLVGSRMTTTTNATMSVLGFTNGGKTTLKVNGACVGIAEPDSVCGVYWKDVPLKEGENEIVLENARGDHAKATWTRISRKNP